MSAVFQQVFILLAFVLSGYILCKFKFADAEHAKIISVIIAYIVLPCVALDTCSKRFTVEYISENYTLLIAGISLLFFTMIIAHFAAKLFSKNSYERYIFEYSLIIPNLGYFGYPLSKGLFGEEGLMDMIAFCLPFTLYIYLISYGKLTKRPMNIKGVFNPALVATIIGCIIGLSGLQMPNLFATIFASASDCQGPLAMLLAGMVISQFNLKEISSDKKVIILSVLRLIVIPLCIGGLLTLFLKGSALYTSIIFLSLPCGMNTIVFPKQIGENSKLGAGIACVSTFASLITIPVICAIFNLF